MPRPVTGAPEYDSADYWEARFARVAADEECHKGQSPEGTGDSHAGKRCLRSSSVAQDGIEWLGNGEILLKPLCEHIGSLADQEEKDGLRILHLGAGVSDLSLAIADAMLGYGVSLDRLINVDFAPSALVVGKRRAKAWARGHGMTVSPIHFCCADLRRWTALCASLSEIDVDPSSRPFTAIVDKSTSDSLATAERTELASLFHSSALSPLISSLGDKALPSSTSVLALDLVAFHLAALTQTGGIWLVLSFSEDRFDFLAKPEMPSLSKPFWHIEKRAMIPCPSGSDKSSAPPVYHHYFALRRR